MAREAQARKPRVQQALHKGRPWAREISLASPVRVKGLSFETYARERSLSISHGLAHPRAVSPTPMRLKLVDSTRVLTHGSTDKLKSTLAT
ncbi:hypothetical protein CRG98_012303 [Punica granatum]|uniref:Uncharacterized protein n=1 Tax=Punica granatum TaxID=22663 RepID=A0A2I0KHJ6_PUNGR|nr:hypothetical protein CRG98_012303 [Punica granatum]